MESNEEKELYKLSEPIPLTNIMVNRPLCMVLVAFTTMIVISGFVAYMGWLQPDEMHDRDYFVWGDEYVNNYDKSRLAQSELNYAATEEVVPL